MPENGPSPAPGTAELQLPMPERTGDCPFCGDARRLWRVSDVLICSQCLTVAMWEANRD